MRRAFVVVLAMLIMGSATLLAANLKKENPGAPSVPPQKPAAVLYDQTDNAAGNGAPDQDFEASYNTYDSFAADDFVVPASGWQITRVNTVGTVSAGGTAAVSVDVSINANAAGIPGSPVAGCNYPAMVPTAQGPGNLTLDLTPACNLAAGTYWVVIQVNQDYATAGQHFWSNRTVQSGLAGMWMNPGNGFATGCTTWTAMTICGVGGGTAPDFLYSLEGNILPVELQTFNVE
ncbi:MAG: hypothetical protein HY825_20770 [Acidobacteria bacterium]|nr:hypothetical protein [Acidobacteriota bacterium]